MLYKQVPNCSVRIILSILVALLSSRVTDAYKILALFSHPGKSHGDVFLPLLKALAIKGHEVTVVSYYPQTEVIPNYRDIVLEDTNGLVNIFDLHEMKNDRWQMYTTGQMIHHFGGVFCQMGFQSNALRKLLNSTEHFDLILTEFFNSDCFLGFVHKFKGTPLIGLSSCTLLQWTNARVGNPSHPAYIPHNFMDYSDRKSFLERVESSLVNIWNQWYFDNVIGATDKKLAKMFFGKNLPSLHRIAYNTSLILVNSHFTLNFPRPLVPAVVEVGGIHMRQSRELPHDIEKWIKESTHGVIYFSLGSMIKGHTFPEDKRRAFLKAFSRLPQRIIWKWENDTMPDKPDNVMVQKWMPQLDILAHSNVRAFISHGGLLGTIEAVHFGVPVVVMPQYGDQFTNAKAIEASGGGVILYLRTATEEQIYNALTKVLSPSFRQKAHELSVRFRDRPLPPLETAIYWVEYVARHRGAPHMRTAAVDMPFYQYLLLDVIAFLLAILIALIALIYYTIKFCCCRRSKKTKSD